MKWALREEKFCLSKGMYCKLNFNNFEDELSLAYLHYFEWGDGKD